MLFLFFTTLAMAANCSVEFAKLAVRTQTVALQDRAVSYQFHPVENSKGTVLLLNGLMIRMKDWDSYRQSLQEKGYSVLQMSYSGQPESLVHSTFPAPSGPVTGEMLAEEIEAVVKASKASPPLHIHAYSYGSFPGLEYAKRNPKQVKSLSLINPMAKSLDNYIPQAAMANATMNQMKTWNAMMDPFGLFGGARQIANLQETAYRNSVRDSLKKYKAGTHYAESLDRETFEAGTIELTMGAKEFSLADYADETLPKVNLVLSKEEFYPQMREDQLSFFQSLQGKAKGKLHTFEQYGHNDVLGEAEDDFLNVLTPLLEENTKATR